MSVDPERDDLTRIGAYVRWFDGRIRGLTGSRAQLDHAVQALGLHYERVTEDGVVRVEHSTAAAVVDPQGRLVGYTLRPSDGAAFARDLRAVLD